MFVPEHVGAFIGLLIFLFLSPAIGRFIAVKIFKCPEWDKNNKE